MEIPESVVKGNLGNNFFQGVCIAYDLDYDENLIAFQALRRAVSMFCTAPMFLCFGSPETQRQREILRCIQLYLQACEQETHQREQRQKYNVPEIATSSNEIPSTPSQVGSAGAVIRMVSHGAIVSTNPNLRRKWCTEIAVLSGIILGGHHIKKNDACPRRYTPGVLVRL
eukprot:TRINITY_DN14001_c0_g1_i1.p1 TRINITY_DN14001_c0_g1~~TRINITY_DN14001_c0_g1_i1.p1  ORF type:complete len:170 (-),score=9.09 TRINITY_DN14001_c0_g1_i1:326-835(-)